MTSQTPPAPPPAAVVTEDERAANDYAKTLETWASMSGIRSGCKTAFLAGAEYARSTGAGVSREWVEPRERRPYNWAYPYAFLEALEDTMLGEDYAPTLEGIELVLLGYEELIGRGIPLPLAPTTPKDEK